MPHSSFSSPIHASFATLWEMLVDKVENPQRYITEVESVTVVERFDDGILRDMTIPGMRLKERIVVDEAAKEIKFILVDHPLFAGEIINKVEVAADSDGESLILTFAQNWQPLNAEAENIDPEPLAQAMKNAVLHMKQLAEDQEK